MGFRYNGALYMYAKNIQGDIIGIVNEAGSMVVEYTYDAWGNLLEATGSVASTVGAANPLRYRGYYYDEETGLYCLQSRYYNPEWGRFINADSADVLASSSMAITDKNLFAYCDNNPVMRTDVGGEFWDIFVDIVSVVVSVCEVIANPTSVEAWAALGADVACAVIPGVTGGGAVVRAVTKADDVVDIAKIATTGSPNEIGRIGEKLAGITSDVGKKHIEINGRIRIPDKMTDTTLTEVKNVKYLSNTQQLRDFADYAEKTGRKLELYVRPTTKLSKNIDPRWNIKRLW